MKSLWKKRALAAALVTALAVCGLTGTSQTWAAADEQLSTQVAFEFAVMMPGRRFTFTAESATLPNLLVIPLFIINDGQSGPQLTATLSKQNSTGELVTLALIGTGYFETDFNAGITPRSISVSSVFWFPGTAIIYAAMPFSPDPGPYSYSVTVTFN